ncbi:MAG: aminotransferase class III-fold pyridoxal phosphate-dependent enzyme, partial [Candidatus Thermoplasmatota archaeon]
MIVAHVQARIGSTRLPGKVLRDIVGKPMLWHIVNRLKRSKLIDKIVIVTSTNEEDKAILEFGEKEGIETFAGSEEDLVDRHYQAAKKYKADVIVRITGDCPLVDPKVVDKIIKYFLDGKFDYASNIEKCTYPDGLDVQVLSYSALETIWKKCKKPLERELFSAYIKLHPEKFKIGNVEQEQDLSHMRWTVDYEEDLRFVREVYKRLYKKGEIFYMEDVLQLLKKEPELMDINKGLKSPEGRIEWVLEKTKRESASTKLTKSYKYLEKAKKIIPGGTQTFSKSYNQFPLGVSPIYLQRGKGCYVWDIDNNKYIDYILALAPVILGYSYPRVDKAIKDQLKSGIIFSLPHPLELELAEKLTKIIPCCEMVRFGKNGSDATSGAIRVARAFTGRDKIACCGYHGWQDWYICSTTRDKGIPKSIHNLTYTFKYNNIESLEKIFDENKNELAAVILEPISTIEPKNNFLKKVKKITHENDAILIFDEIVTGFRLAVGGAQEYYNVTPDLACLGKSMANGMPLSAIVGKEELMKE